MIIIIFLLSTLLFFVVASYYINKTQKVKRRVQQFIPSEPRVLVKEPEQQKEPNKKTIKDLIKTLARNIKPSEHQRKTLESQLETADIPLRVEEFITIRLVIFGFVFFIFLVAGISILISIFISFIAWIIPTLYVKKKKESRIALSVAQLPQALEIMANAMKSGFSFMQAMHLVSTEMSDPLGVEFSRTIKEINYGVSTEIAFENLLKRLPNQDLEIVVTAVLIQRSTGGNLAYILETIQETISERVRMKDELRALTAQGRMSAIIITFLPVGLGGVLYLMNPDYFTPMFSHPLGWVFIGTGVVSGILGWIFINKVVTIEV